MKPTTFHGDRRFLLTPLALAVALFLTACGGGDDSEPPAVATALPPTISAQPVEQAVTTGNAATFSVTASGDALTYQWQVSQDHGASWTDIASATASTYTVAATAPALNGTQYRAVINSAGASVTSAPVTLTVAVTVTAPVISVDVAAVAVNAGSDAVFTVTASGSTLVYQWQTSTDGTTFTNVAGATSATLTLPAVALADSGKTVRVTVSNSAGTVNSTAVSLYVTPVVLDATLLSQPASMSAIAPSPATFTVTAAGTPAPTFQWQKSTDGGVTWTDIDGATAASYTTPATALTDTGSLFRVSATNATATAVSDAAALTVEAAAVPVAITTQPTALAIAVPSTATFSVVASGSPTPTYQWQVKGTAADATFANITGATLASYTTPATLPADSGKQFQVVVTNSSGSVTSAPVVLTATASTTVSKLTGRAWTVGQSLESGDTSVTNPLVGIDDAGNALSLFEKSDGTRSVLYATRGVSGAAGTAPVWSTPVAIDTAEAPAGTSARAARLAPNGNAAVVWRSTAPCTASTYTVNVNSSCNYIYISRYSVTANRWTAPVQLVDTPDQTPDLTLRLNSEGDLALLYPGWIRTGTTGSTNYPAVAWQAEGQSSVTKRVFDDISLKSFNLGMDKDGNLLLAGSVTQNSTTDIVAYRGSVQTGFGVQELLDQRTSAAQFEGLAVGLNGQAIVLWNQSNGTVLTRFTADAATPGSAWSVKEMEPYKNTGSFATTRLMVSDAGVGIYAEYTNGSCHPYFHNLTSGAWSQLQRFPTQFPNCGGDYVSNRNGDLLIFSGAGWTSYDAATNSVIRLNTAAAPSVYDTSGGSVGTVAEALSVRGVGVITVAVPYDTLPTVVQPAGDGRSSVINLWGLFLK